MILIKSNSTNEKHKVYKYDLQTEFTPEQVLLIDDEKISAERLYKTACENIENLNKRLEKARLLARAIECSFNKFASTLIRIDMIQPVKQGRVKGHFITSIDSQNGIFIH